MMSGVSEFFELLKSALAAPTPKLFIVAGLLFLGVAILGNITGRIQPGPIGRILGGVVGPLLIVSGVTMEVAATRVVPPANKPPGLVAAEPTVISTQSVV